MKVVTLVKGRVPTSRLDEFEEGYSALKERPPPPGLERSYLLHSTENTEVFTIVTVWESREALDKMRNSSEPAAPALFKKIGATPSLEIHEVSNTLP